MLASKTLINDDERRRATASAVTTMDHLGCAQETIWLLAALTTPLFVNFWVDQPFEASKIWLLRSLIWLLVFLSLIRWMRGDRWRPLPLSVRWLATSIGLILLVATVHSQTPFIALTGSLERANGFLTQSSYLLLFLIVAGHLDRRGIQRLIRLIVLTGVPISLLGLAQLAGWQPVSLISDARSPLITTLGRANFTGAYLALLLPLTLACSLAETHRSRKRAYILLFVLCIVLIALTRARAAWIGAGVGTFLFVWLRWASDAPDSKRWIPAGAATALLLAVLIGLWAQGMSAQDSIAARWTIWRASLRLIWPQLWLGYGADTMDLFFPAVYPPELVYYQGRGVAVDRAHNWLLDWTFSYGAVATLLASALVFYILRMGWMDLTNRTKRSSEAHSLWTAAAMAGIGSHLVGNLFLFEVAATALLFWMLLAVILTSSAVRLRETQPVVRSRSLRIGVLAVGLALLGAGVWYANVSPMIASYYSRQASLELQRGRRHSAQEGYRVATLWSPQRSEYHLAHGLIEANRGALNSAEASLLRAIELRPTDPMLYVHLGRIYAASAEIDLRRQRQAATAFKTAIRLAPDIGLLHRHYAEYALRIGDLPIALSRSSRAVDLDATDGIAYSILGWAHYRLGNADEALRAFEAALRWEPDLIDTLPGEIGK